MSTDLRTKTILIIDDMASVRSALRQMLATLGVAEVDFSTDGDEALRRMENKSYDIILCDYNLGEGRDGMQILEAAKQRHWIGLSTVFAMITAESTVAMVLGAMEYRPDGYLIKPITRQMLQERLGRLVARKDILVDIERAIREEKLAQATTMTAAQIKAQPSYAFELMQIQADLLIRQGLFEAASEVFEAAAAIRNAFWVNLGRGQVRYYLGDYKKAITIFTALINENRMHTEAYDWLARVQQASGNFQAAKETLVEATKISPRSILRAQALGEVSLRTDDATSAEQAYRNAVRLGRFSVYGDPNDSARLARVLMERGNPKDASRIIKDARRQYQGNPNAALALAISEASNCHQLNLSEAAARMVEEAIDTYQDARDNLPPDLAIEFAKLCHTYDRDAQAAGIMTHTVLHHVEDTAIMDRAREVFELLGMGQIGNQFISDLWNKVAAANNEGVRLLQEGKLNEGKALLEKAANDMPFNITININAARVLLIIMEKQGRHDELLARARTYLDHVPISQRTHNDKYQRLNGAWTKLASKKS
ncbi:putative Response regulator [Gammaproteobacteria bacterium]